ncbi:MAG: Cof-type HAD-IIB family hydrolase [Blastocatellia bacterium]|nr:Cof-type HAD-IIB family hydrolase [Blastocatellia bacterium]
MQFRMLACDYDRTLANEGAVSARAEQALTKAKKAEFMLGLVTGRALDDLLNVCPQIPLFDMVVAENGAVVHLPASGVIKDLAAPPGRRFMEELTRRGVPFSSGRVIVGTVRPHEHEVLSAIEMLGLDLEIIFNKQDVMVLPSGVNKATGLEAGLEMIDVSASEIIAIGDAENDLAFLRASGFAVAVANALDSVKEEADFVTSLPAGDGVAEFVNEHLLRAIEDLTPRRKRKAIAD